jgi:hypothetical protein
MGKQTTIGIYEQDLSRFNTVAFALQKSQPALIRILATELEALLKDAIENEAKKGNVQLFYSLSTKRTGLTLQLALTPRIKVVHESVPTNSEEPTTEEIEKKVFKK